jgi:glycosyltransferase involved in cell wall biosynthesis
MIKRKVVLLQTAIGDYRSELLSILCKELGSSFEIVVGDNYFDESVKTNFFALPQTNVRRIENIFLGKRTILWQRNVVSELFCSDVVIMEMNPRIVSTWILAVLRNISGKKTIMWGHAWPRNGAGAKSDIIRHWLRSLGSTVMVYTESQKTELKAKYASLPCVIAAPNALYSVKNMWVPHEKRTNFIYVGRLVANKKPQLLLSAFHKIVGQLGIGCRLYIVGEGPEKSGLQKYVDRNGLGERVIIAGHISSIEGLRKIYAKTVASISPGYVGLSVTQSLSFGTPMIISKNELHAPEIEAVREGENAVFFKTDDVSSLSDAMLEMYGLKDEWASKASAIIEDCKGRYSAEHMASRMLEAING